MEKPSAQWEHTVVITDDGYENSNASLRGVRPFLLKAFF